ncbi:P110/LppT family adhesin N-terminal domain [Mesomycoplasma ovipneumoniae]|uniref:P110/LppT family adhesin N-terminal domain n=1 Tax=Mesomycoplasma ovipneumoniae TaxID=29562 RepID=A0AAW6Q5U6_9BACT|nr:P110/LppT family adhesin N-terminal domain [Mesomycoplasma ovipneumoniae]MDF9627962.1 P110/LppT family adhesin N-terminal domain [Mesomycoplasma ovipneumoniae]MDO4158002.1 P110/LppT family adhesin N-terminal domain [Mesomycoplasma ovipneumoniae]MDO4158153.1 P110/LppT family adhesin N-terminal domain [Mesomycoplasma ovipneumoniae]MDO6821843.1 P110/LppT family adhesin N-terminal domain [Mesomycoplasma ovipneumoniae]MDO6855683.1 P110/LppT family adhesin N-terminal domain [Mesomycoplasma ovipne
MLNKENKSKSIKTIISTGFSITAILTTIVAVPIGLTIFERSYSSQIFGNVDKNEVVNLKTQSTFSEEDFINALNELKLHDQYKDLSAKTALALAKNPSYSFNFLNAYDFSPITKHNFRVVLDIEKASPSGTEVKNVVVYAHSDQFKLTYSKQTDLKGFAQSDKADGDLVGFQIDLEKSKLELTGTKNSNLVASEVAFKLDNDFQAFYKRTRSKSQAFSDALFQNGLAYNLVNTLGLPSILEKGYVLAPKTVENQKAKQEKIVMVGDSDTQRVDSLMKVENLVFKNLNDNAGTLSISFELKDPTGKLIKEFDFPILGIKKLSDDVKAVEQKILTQFSDFVQLKPLVQIALVKDNLSLAQIVYKTDNNPVNLATVLSKITQNSQQIGRQSQISTQLFQDSGQNSQANNAKVDINRQDLSAFFNLKSEKFQVPGIDGYFVKINNIKLAENLTQAQKDKLVQENKVSFEVDFQIEKQLNIEAPYLESEFVKSNYPKVLESSLASLGKGNDSKFVLVDLGSSKSNVEVQLDYDENQRKVLNAVLKQNSEDFTNLDKIDPQDPKFENFNPLAKTFEFKENPNGPKLTLEYVKSLVSEVVEDAKKQKTFTEVAKKLFILDLGMEPESASALQKYIDANKPRFEPASKDNGSEKPKEDEKKTEGEPEKKPEEGAASGSQPAAGSQPSTAGTDATAGAGAAAGAGAPATGGAGSGGAGATTSTGGAQTTASTTAFQDDPAKTKDDPTTKTNTETNEVSTFKGLGVELWAFLQKSNYSALGQTDYQAEVVTKSDSQIDVILTFGPKTETEQKVSNPKAIFSITQLENDADYDVLRSYNPTVFFDFRQNQKTDGSDKITKIQPLNRGDVTIDLENDKDNVATKDGLLVKKAVEIKEVPTAPGQEKPAETQTTTGTTTTPTETPTTTTTTATDDSKKQILDSGVIFLAFQPRNISDNKKHYLISSKDGQGIFIKKTKLGEGKTEKFVLGLDQIKRDNKPTSIVALISGADGEVDPRLEFKEQSSTSGSVGTSGTSEVENIIQFLPLFSTDPFRQTNVNKGEVDDFDFIKDGDLIFLTILKNKSKWTIWLSSSKAKNPYNQRISSALDLTFSFSDKTKSLTWTHLGPKVDAGSASGGSGEAQSQTTTTETASPTQILFKGFAVYDSPTLATNVETVSTLNNLFIKKFIK